MSSNKRSSCALAHKPEVEAPGSWASKSRIAEGLKEVGSIYGKVIAVSPMFETARDNAENDMFLIHFDKTLDALAASQALKGLLYGFTTLAVSVPRHSQDNPQILLSQES